jgi:hypothetical protein
MISYLVTFVPRPLFIDRPIFREIRWIDDEDGKFLLSPFAYTELSKSVHDGIVKILVQTLALVLKVGVT